MGAGQIAQTEPAPVEPTVYFFDDFGGEDLAEHWEVLNPDPDAFIVEDGALLIVRGTPGSMADKTVQNLFKLSKAMPEGDGSSAHPRRRATARWARNRSDRRAMCPAEPRNVNLHALCQTQPDRRPQVLPF